MRHFLHLQASLVAQPNNNNFWKNYSCGRWVFDIKFDGAVIWIANTGGITEINQSTGQTYFYNASNSGLHNNLINKIVIDQYHVKWIGAGDGLYTFDGTIWKYFNTGHVTDLEIDINNDIWFLGNNPITGVQGLIQYDGNTFNTVNSALPNNDLSDLTTDNNKNLYLIAGYLIMKYDGQTWQIFNNTNPLLDQINKQSLTIDANDRIWIGSTYAIHVFDGTNWSILDTINSPLLQYAAIDGIAADDSGNVYISNGKQMIKTDATNYFIFNNTNSPAAEHRFFRTVFDQYNQIWVGTAGNGIYNYDYLQWTNYNTSGSGLQSYITTGLEVGKKDEIWLNMGSYISLKKDTVWSLIDTLPPNISQIGKMAIDTGNIFWAGLVYGGPGSTGPLATYFDGSMWSFTTFNNNVCYEVAVDKQNTKWFATNIGLVKFDNTAWNVYSMSNSPLVSNNVYHVYADWNDNIWVVANQTLQKFDGINWQTFDLQAFGFPPGSIAKITSDLGGNIYIVTTTNTGLMNIGKYDGATWTLMNQLPGDQITAIAFDKNNDLWVAFYLLGLGKYEAGTWTVYNPFNSGLPGHLISSIKADRYNNIWVSCSENGVAVFNDREIQFTNLASNQVLVSGKCYFDSNTNGIKDATEQYLNAQKFNLTPINTHSMSNSFGDFNFYLPMGNYSLSPELHSGWYVSSDSSTYQIEVDSSNLSGFDFGIYAPPFSECNLNMYSAINRCGFAVPNWIHFSNTGSYSDSGYVELIIDTTCTFISAYPAPDLITGNVLRWNFSPLVPFRDNYIRFELLIPNNPGDSILHTSKLHYYNTGVPTLCNQIVLIDQIVCAFDPNDKTVMPVGLQQQHFTLKTDTLIYTIRFQNIGNDTAFFVKVIDTLDVNLDAQSVQVISASHIYQMINDNGVLTFNFPTCNLPPESLDYSGSCGYISFKVKPNSNLSNNTIVNNKASILFNFNESISTNEVFNTFVDNLTEVNQITHVNQKLKIIPNPFSVESNIYIPNSSQEMFSISIKNMLGKEIYSLKTFENNFTISREYLKPGLFILEISTSDKLYIEKIVVQ